MVLTSKSTYPSSRSQLLCFFLDFAPCFPDPLPADVPALCMLTGLYRCPQIMCLLFNRSQWHQFHLIQVHMLAVCDNIVKGSYFKLIFFFNMPCVHILDNSYVLNSVWKSQCLMIHIQWCCSGNRMSLLYYSWSHSHVYQTLLSYVIYNKKKDTIFILLHIIVCHSIALSLFCSLCMRVIYIWSTSSANKIDLLHTGSSTIWVIWKWNIHAVSKYLVEN